MHDVPVEILAGALPTGADINLGTPILFRFDLILDYSRGRAWFTPSATATTAPCTRGLLGVGATRRAPDRLTVTFVSSHGPGHDAGLVVGDQIIAVDGVSIANLPADQPEFGGGEAAPTS